jgi:hypothetical protein
MTNFEDFENALNDILEVVSLDSDKFSLDVLETALIECIFQNMDGDEGKAELDKRIDSMKEILNIWYDGSEYWDDFERKEKIRLVVSNDKND